MSRRRLRAVLIALGACVASCRAGGPPPLPEPVRVARQTPVLSLDPTESEPRTISALGNVFEPLVAYDRDLNLVPALATRWETPDETTWVFSLRRGVSFHDGSPLDAGAVVAALERARLSPESTVHGYLWAVSGVEAIDTHSVRIRTRVPDALLLHGLTFVLVARGATRAEIEGRPVGTGPYRVARWRKGDALDLEAWDDYWGPSAVVRKVRIIALPSAEDGTAALARRDAEIAEIPPSAARAAPPDGVRFVTTPGLTTFYLWMNGPTTIDGRANPFADVRVRRAAASAIDRARLARAATGTEATAAPQLVPPTVFGHVPSLTALPYDPAAARALLQSAGYALPLETTLAYRAVGTDDPAASALQKMLDAAGFRVTLRPVPWDQIQAELRHGRFDLLLGGWTFDGPDAGGFLRDCIRSREANGRTGLFNPGYVRPEIDRLVDASSGAFVRSSRLSLLEEAMRIANDDAPLVPLFHRPDAWAVTEGLEWEPRPDGKIVATEMRPAGGER
ncbi:MAG: ABC transporter substrate-binding protein [Thermoanaerobaculia bacterium]